MYKTIAIAFLIGLMGFMSVIQNSYAESNGSEGILSCDFVEFCSTSDVTKDRSLILAPDIPEELSSQDNSFSSTKNAFTNNDNPNESQQNNFTNVRSSGFGFTKFINSEYGFEFEYPSNWEELRLSSSIFGSPINVAYIGSPSTDPILGGVVDALSIDIIKPTQYLDPDIMEVRTSILTAPEYAKIAKDSLNDIGVEITRENTINVSGISGYRIEYLTIGQYFVEVFVSNKDGNLYSFDFHTPSLNAPQSVPVFDKILESFRFT